MAVISNRSLNAELDEGSVDGTYKKMPPNRSNVEVPLIEERDMSWRYGFEDMPGKRLPTGGPARRQPTDHG